MPPGSGNETGPSSVEGGTPPAGGEGIGRQREESGFSSSGLVQVWSKPALYFDRQRFGYYNTKI